MKRKMLLCFVVVFASAAIAKDMEVEIVGYPKEIPRGITQVPLNVEIRSKRPLTVWQIRDSLVVTDGRGRGLPRCPVQGNDGPIWGMFWPAPKVQAIPSGWSYLWASGMWCADWDGDLLVRALVRGESARAVKALDSDHPLWRREIRSQEVHIRYVEPTGIDKEAYEALGANPMGHPCRLLRDYPTSTYTAYSLFSLLASYGAGAPGVIKMARDGVYFDASLPVPDETCASNDGWTSILGSDLAAWRHKWIQTLLAANSELWFRDLLRMRRAEDLLGLGQYREAANAFRDLAQKPTGGSLLGPARKYLSLMLADGMIKPSAIPAELRAKLPKVEPPAKKPVAKD